MLNRGARQGHCSNRKASGIRHPCQRVGTSVDEARSSASPLIVRGEVLLPARVTGTSPRTTARTTLARCSACSASPGSHPGPAFMLNEAHLPVPHSVGGGGNALERRHGTSPSWRAIGTLAGQLGATTLSFR